MTRRIDSPDTPADEELRKHLKEGENRSFIVVAGAGSGKTTSLIKALDYVEKQHGAELRRHGQQVACITYTEIAVGEILGDVGHLPLFHVSTIHSFLWALAKPFQTEIKRWVKARIDEKIEKLKKEASEFSKRVQQKTRDKNARKTASLEEMRPKIDAVARFDYGTGSKYASGMLGHDDIIVMVPQLILDHPLMVSIIAQKYPFFFVDESQDTFPQVVEALRSVAKQWEQSFCLGFFGDPMQKVYMAGVGPIQAEDGWRPIKKPENFRCPTKVLKVINGIRSQADKLEQTGGKTKLVNEVRVPVIGSARIFVLPADENDLDNLDKVRQWLAKADQKSEWLSNDPAGNVRILVVEHRMAARRLGFDALHAAFKDGTSSSLEDGYDDGTAWPLRPFQDVLLPLCEAYAAGHGFSVVQRLRTISPRLSTQALQATENTVDWLKSLNTDVQKLTNMLAAGSAATVREVLQFAQKQQLLELDERFAEYLQDAPRGEMKAAALNDADEDREGPTLRTFMACPANQLAPYHVYKNELSRYATHQGVKGAEFARVLVVIADDESKHRLFSYEKLLGIKPPSDTDRDHVNEGTESVFDRTRRLFYVCCSRAADSLAVVVFTENPASAIGIVKKSGLFEVADVLGIGDIDATL